MSDDQYRWPKAGEQLFRFDIGDQSNACLNFIGDQFDLYAVGYKRAADLLVEHVLDTNSNQDILIYPIAFLYRHYLELRMKDIIKDGNLLLDSINSYPKDHGINNLWDSCKVIIKQLDQKNSLADELEAIDDIIKEFSKIDPTSMAFRYPTDKKDNPSLPGIRHINLGNLKYVMESTAHFLDATSGILCIELDFKMEADRIHNEFNEAAEAEFNSYFSIDKW